MSRDKPVLPSDVSYKKKSKDSASEAHPPQPRKLWLRGVDFILLLIMKNHIINYTIFYPQLAKAIASAPYKLDSIIYRAHRIFPLKHLDAFDIIATNAE